MLIFNVRMGFVPLNVHPFYMKGKTVYCGRHLYKLHSGSSRKTGF